MAARCGHAADRVKTTVEVALAEAPVEGPEGDDELLAGRWGLKNGDVVYACALTTSSQDGGHGDGGFDSAFQLSREGDLNDPWQGTT